MLRRLFKAAAAKADTVTVVHPVDPVGRNEWSCAAGVVIDGVVCRLEGEPAPYAPSVHVGGNGQR